MFQFRCLCRCSSWDLVKVSSAGRRMFSDNNLNSEYIYVNAWTTWTLDDRINDKLVCFTLSLQHYSSFRILEYTLRTRNTLVLLLFLEMIFDVVLWIDFLNFIKYRCLAYCAFRGYYSYCPVEYTYVRRDLFSGMVQTENNSTLDQYS